MPVYHTQLAFKLMNYDKRKVLCFGHRALLWVHTQLALMNFSQKAGTVLLALGIVVGCALEETSWSY